MKQIKSNKTILTENAVIEKDLTKGIYVQKGVTLTIKGTDKKYTTVMCLIYVEEGGTLVIEQNAEVMHVCNDGGKVVIKGKCFYLYHKGGDVDIRNGTVNILEFLNILHCCKERKRKLIMSDGHIDKLLCDSNGAIFAYKSHIECMEINANMAINLKESTIDEGIFYCHCYIVHIGDKSEIKDVKIENDSEIIHLNLPSTHAPIGYFEALDEYRRLKRKSK